MSTDEVNPADPVADFERERAELMRALTPVLAAAGVPKPAAHAPEVVEYLRRLGFAVSTTGVPVDAATTNRYLAVALDITIAEAGGAPRTCATGTRTALALHEVLARSGLHLVRAGQQWRSCRL